MIHNFQTVYMDWKFILVCQTAQTVRQIFWFSLSMLDNPPFSLRSEQICQVSQINLFVRGNAMRCWPQFSNWEFYSCVPGVTWPIKWQQGLRWPWFDRNFSLFSFKCKLVSIRTTSFTVHYQSSEVCIKTRSSLALLTFGGQWADNCKIYI